jgi:hypothetical protein
MAGTTAGAVTMTGTRGIGITGIIGTAENKTP